MTDRPISRREFLRGTDPGSEPLTISSMIVQMRERDVPSVSARIRALPGAEIHGPATNGKLVVVVETPSDGALTERMTQISGFPGVLGVNLVFHHSHEADSA